MRVAIGDLRRGGLAKWYVGVTSGGGCEKRCMFVVGSGDRSSVESTGNAKQVSSALDICT